MGKKDYERVTKPQSVRDGEALKRIKAELVDPLVDELEADIPGYRRRNVSDLCKFVEIMRRNAEQAEYKGHSLPLDFGSVKGKASCSGLVFAGEGSYDYREEGEYFNEDTGELIEGVTVYSPKFSPSNTGLFGEDHMWFLEGLPPQTMDYAISGNRKEYEKLPTAYKVAVVAQLVSQTVLVPYYDACRFAAGWVDSIEPRRWMATPLQSKDFGPHGWLVAIRDQKPENEQMRYYAGMLRSLPPIAQSTLYHSLFFNDADAHNAQYHTEREKRTRRARTDALVEFIDVVLPARGYHVGRVGEGKQLSFKNAYTMFSEEYPEYAYRNVRSFCNAYYNARKTRKEDEAHGA